MVTSIPNSGPDPRGTFRLLRSLPSPLIPGQAASSDPSYTTSLDSNILIDKSLHLVEKTTQIHWGMSMRIGAHCHAGLFIAMVLLLSSCADQEPLEDICEDCSENETCTDNIQNGSETDVDCGGLCGNCIMGKKCSLHVDCSSNNCKLGRCSPSSCTDQIKNGLETDTDCGGKNCPACPDLMICDGRDDCLSDNCFDWLCISCRDEVTDGFETDVDCGGEDCSPCADGKDCLDDRDCESEKCRGNKCVSCVNDTLDGTETDVDCGGDDCPKCPDLMNCLRDEDCFSALCYDRNCVSCSDNVQNSTESDVDCGGENCPKCLLGDMCLDEGDCVSNGCMNGVCCELNQCGTCGPLPLEDCNGVDDDCDGRTDEQLGSSSCGKGICAQEIQTSCVDGEWTSCDPYYGSNVETCNLVDDNCDGITDNGLGTFQCGKGRCQHSVANCVDGSKGDCDQYLGARTESCNSIDDDCDGSTDESLGTYSCGIGRCQHNVQNCVNGGKGVCDPKLYAITEKCDNIDDDCDGSTDDYSTACYVQSPIVWRGWFSEDSSPNYDYCPSGYALVGWRCSGDFCDNQSLRCGKAPFSISTPKRAPGWYSEESGTFKAGAGEIVVGAQCSGDYCDSLNFYVAKTGMPFVHGHNCTHTGRVSDENGTNGLQFISGYYAVEVTCLDDYCDSKTFLICKP